MIIYKGTKEIETRSNKPNENWTEHEAHVIDDDSDLAERIQQNYPFFELVIEDGKISDIELWSDDKIQQYKEEQKANRPPTEMELMQQELDQKDQEIADSWFDLMANQDTDGGQDDDIADLYYELMEMQSN